MIDAQQDRIFVGDVHGCAAELDELLALLEFRPERHRLFFVGDLVNRGPDSLGVLRRVIGLGADSVLGNHDLHLLALAAGQRKPRRDDTVHDVLHAPDRDDLLDWLRARPVICCWDDLVMVHAGLHPEWTDPEAAGARIERSIDWDTDPFDNRDLAFATRVRFCDSEGRFPPRKKARRALARVRPGVHPRIKSPWAPWDDHYVGDRLVVFGHWAQRGLVQGPRLRGLDTGCVWGGRLTAWIATEDRFVSVPSRRVYQEVE